MSVLPVLLLGLASCGEDAADPSAGDTGTVTSADGGDKIAGLTVTGEVGEEPKVTVDAPLELEETQSAVITTGQGRQVTEGSPATLQLHIVNGTTGKKAASTYDQGGATSLPIREDALFPALHEALLGVPSGSRVAVAGPVEDIYGPAGAGQLGLKAKDDVVLVADVLAVPLQGPEGTQVADLPPDAPTIEQSESGDVTGLSWTNTPRTPPKQLQVIPVIEGTGEPVEKGDAVTFDYLGQVYRSDKVFDESYTKEPITFSVGVNQLIKAWDEGLVGVREGSRVLIVAPPETAYGEQGSPPDIPGGATLAFVVDVLGVS